MPDDFPSHSPGLDSPATFAFAVTPHASNELARVTRAIYVGRAGDITCRLANDSVDVVFVGVPAGSLLPIRARFIRASGTTATSIVGLA